MPRRKQWRKSDSKRRERSRTDESETAVRSVGSPSNGVAGLPATTLDGLPAVGSPSNMVVGSPSNLVAQGSPSNVVATGSPSNVVASQKANHSSNHSSNHSNSQETQRNYQTNISQFKQAIIDFKSIIASDSSNTQTDFDIVFLDTFPDVAANYQSKDNKELFERESIAVCPVNTSQQNEALDRNVTAQYHLSSDPLEICSDIDVACYQAIRSSELLWNASDLVFGSFHQNDGRFSEHSRGYQCTCNALCMLSYANCGDVDNTMVLDKVLYEGDALYQKVIRKLKSDGKFIQHLLSLEEIPDNFEVEIGKFTLEKIRIVSGPLIDTQDLGFPTLHEVLQSAFSSVSSGLLTIGAICSAVFKKKGSYAFFYSHCHGHNGLSATDGASCLITFSSLDDLVTYMYAFYDSMKLDTNLQYDFLPINVKKAYNKQSYKDKMASHMQGYFNDQRLRQAKKTQSEIRSIANDLASISIEKTKTALGAKRNKHQNRTEYNKTYMRKYRQNPAFKAKERESKQSARKDPVFKTKERESKQTARRNPVFRAKEIVYQKVSKQSTRKDPVFKRKERESKQPARRNPVFKAKEIVYQKVSKQSTRKDPVFKTKERESKQSARRNPVFRTKETVYQKESKQSARRNPVFRAKETVYQKGSKQSARKDPVFKGNEIVYQKKSKQRARENQTFKEQEKECQNQSKKRARENPYVLECERIKKQQIRQEKRKINDDLEITVPRKKIKHDIDLLPKKFQKNFETIEESIKRFHSDISFGPIYVCSCCHQTWFRKSVSMLKNCHIPAESKRLYCTEFTSVGNEEWICHTCLSALRDSKLPKLSVANGMKWPDKPPELNLHQLEERLIALRIPFMQIRELPRGGQYSLKGNVINVPVDIQPTINCLPRPMDENFTVAIQLKKKLSYKKVDFKENVRPLRVLSALHWLMKNSELYKKSGIVVDDNWFQDVTESAEDTVREFLEVSKEQCKDKNYTENEKQKQEKTAKDDIEASNDYDSDHYSEIDANDHVGNIDTLVDDADIENKYDKVFTFAPGEGQHPLSLYQDKDAEYLCFPTIFCGQTPPSRDERLVPVHYSDIVKWELRSVDRRAAQSVPNIFFKHKKLQMKQISDKVKLAVRRCKKRGQ